MTETGGVSYEADPALRRVLVHGVPRHVARSAIFDLVIPALLLRNTDTAWSELVHVSTAHGPTVASAEVIARKIRQAATAPPTTWSNLA